jgi:DNA-binding transcriptional LysR family regulator
MTHRPDTPPAGAPRAEAPIRARADGVVGGGRIELRQLRYFVTLAEELHFGRAAAREHIAPSALSQQVQRLERALGVLLVDRTSRHVELTAAGSRFLIEVRQILRHVDQAAVVARGMALPIPTMRVGVLDEGYDAVRPILRALHVQHPELEIHQVRAGVPEQCRLLADGRLDVGVGRVSAASPTIASELFRLDPLGVVVRTNHRFADLPGVPVSALRDETHLLADEQQAPEFNQFVREICRTAGFSPHPFHGTVQNLRAAVDVVAQGLCVFCAPASADRASAEVRWVPLVPSVPRYPWSLLWRTETPSSYVLSLVSIARRMSREQGWRAAPGAMV